LSFTIAVHIDSNIREDSFAHRWITILEKNDAAVKRLDFRSSDIIEKLRDCDGAMWHWAHNPDDKQAAPKILTTIEKYLKIPVFPNINTAWHYDEKLTQHYIFDALSIPKIPSWVFWHYKDAYEFLITADYPLVFKLSVGAGSANVLKIDDKESAIKIAERMFETGVFPYEFNEFSSEHLSLKQRLKKVLRRLLNCFDRYLHLPSYYLPQKNYAYFQKFLPENTFDIRITVIGDRAFGFIRYNRPGDFRASGSGKMDTNPENIPIEAIQIAHSVSKELDSQSMAYDFLIDENGRVLLNEISYCYVNLAVRECPGFWDSKLQWYDTKMWPEKAHIEDFLSILSQRYNK